MSRGSTRATPRRGRGGVWLTLLACAAALCVALWRPGGADGVAAAIEGPLLDLRFAARGPLPPPDAVAVIAIDDADITHFGSFPPSRAALAQAVDAARRAGAASVALDLLLLDAGDGDAALAAALAAQGRAVLGVARAVDGQGGDAQAGAAVARALGRSAMPVIIEEGPATGAPPATAAAPTQSLLEATAALGHVNIALERDGALRRMPVFTALRADDDVWTLPGLSVAALLQGEPDGGSAALRLDVAGATLSLLGRNVALDPAGGAPLRFYGPGGAIATWPLREAGQAALRGRHVFIGAAATGFGDTFVTPFDDAFPGVEAHATLAANLLQGQVLRRDGVAWAVDVALAPVAALAMTTAVASVAGPALATLAAAVVVAAAAALAQAAFVTGRWLDGVTLLTALGLGGAAGAALRFLRQRRRADNLARYQSPLLAEALASQDLPAFDGRAQQAAALFVDIAGATTRIETLNPAEAATFLRAFHAGVERAATAHGGVVEGFAGDGALVLFGLPAPAPDDADRALACVGALLDEAARLPGGVAVRVGAHCGAVQAAVLGGDRHRHVSLAGDAVNTASRLLEVARGAQATVAVSQDLLDASGATAVWTARLGLRPLGPCALRNRRAPLTVWAGDGRKAGVTTPPGLL